MGMVLVPGVYHFTSAADITGTLVLDGQGSSEAVFVFQVEEALTLINDAAVSLINGVTAANVIWQIGSPATLGTNSIFYGSILAGAGITLNTGATLTGRALAQNAVNLDSNIVTLATAATGEPPITTHDAVLPTLEMVANAGGQTSTAVIQAGATSDGGLTYTNSFPAGDAIVVSAALFPETTDIGKAVSVFVVVKYTSTSGVEAWLMEDGNGDFFAWDQNAESLISIYSADSMGVNIAGQLYSGIADAGAYEVFIGYAVHGGSLICNETPMTFVITQKQNSELGLSWVTVNLNQTEPIRKKGGTLKRQPPFFHCLCIAPLRHFFAIRTDIVPCRPSELLPNPGGEDSETPAAFPDFHLRSNHSHDVAVPVQPGLPEWTAWPCGHTR
jgi:hypothetical protein